MSAIILQVAQTSVLEYREINGKLLPKTASEDETYNKKSMLLLEGCLKADPFLIRI